MSKVYIFSIIKDGGYECGGWEELKGYTSAQKAFDALVAYNEGFGEPTDCAGDPIVEWNGNMEEHIHIDGGEKGAYRLFAIEMIE